MEYRYWEDDDFEYDKDPFSWEIIEEDHEDDYFEHPDYGKPNTHDEHNDELIQYDEDDQNDEDYDQYDDQEDEENGGENYRADIDEWAEDLDDFYEEDKEYNSYGSDNDDLWDEDYIYSRDPFEEDDDESDYLNFLMTEDLHQFHLINIIHNGILPSEFERLIQNRNELYPCDFKSKEVKIKTTSNI